LTSAPHHKNRALGLALATTTSVLWGTVSIVGKVALPGMNASTLSVLRLLFASLFLAVVIGVRTGRGFRAVWTRPPPLLFLAAVGLACNYAFYMLALERAGAATTQVLIQLAPLFLLLLGIFWLKEQPHARQLVGAAVALTGLFMVSWASGRTDGVLAGQKVAGIGCVVFSALSWGGYAAIHKRLGENHASGTTMMWIFLMAAAMLAPTMALETARHPDAVQWGAVAYLCANTVVAYWCFAESLRHIDTTLVAVITTLGPVVTLLLLALNNYVGWSRIGYEELTAGKLVGTALVLGGVVLAITSRSTSRSA